MDVSNQQNLLTPTIAYNSNGTTYPNMWIVTILEDGDLTSYFHIASYRIIMPPKDVYS